MPKVSGYLSDEMYAAARSRDLALSALLQGAVEAALEDADRRRWVDRLNGHDMDIAVLDTVGAVEGPLGRP